MIHFNNHYILYILHNYLGISLDIIENITNLDIENLVVLLSLNSIRDIKHFEYN